MILLAIALVLLLSYNFRPHEQKQLGKQLASASPPPSAAPSPSLAAQVASAEKREASLASPSPLSMQPTPTQPKERPEISQQSPNVAKTLPEETAPQNVVRKYFDSFADRNVSTAYNLFSKAFRNSTSFRKYSDLFSATREVRLSESTLINQTRDNAVVFVQFEEINAEYTAVDWRGPIELVREGSEWRIKTLRELTKVAQPRLTPGAGPNRKPEKRWPKPHIYLQLANDSQRSAALDLKKQLTSLGYDVAGIQSVSGNVDLPTETSELRYFSDGDAAEAQRIASQLQSFFQSSGIIAYLPAGMPYVSHSRQYEIWFSTAFH